MFSGPSKAGVYRVILPGRRIEKGQYLGNQLILEQGRTWEVDVVHVEGHSAALDLTPAPRAFTAPWESEERGQQRSTQRIQRMEGKKRGEEEREEGARMPRRSGR